MRVFWICAFLAGVCWGRQLLPDSMETADYLQANANTTQGLAACTQECLEQHPGPLVCTHQAVFDSPMTKCVQTACPTLTDLLEWETRYAEQCGLEARDEGARDLVIAYVLFGLSTLTVAARILSRARWVEGPGYWWDDWVVLAIWVLSTEMAVCPIFSRIYWTGRDVIGFITVHDIEQVLLWTYISESFYLIGTFGSKLVWILFYLRMWEANTVFRKLCWITAVLLILSMIGYSIGAIITSWPHHFYIGESAIVRQSIWGISLNPAVMGIGIQIVLYDFWTLLLPIPKLIKLTGVSKKRRAAICAVIFQGLAVTACSVVRLTAILALRDSRNPNWDFGHFGTWSKIELHLSIISCNLPAMAGLVCRTMSRRQRHTTIQSDSELEDDSVRSYSKSSTTETGQSVYIEDESTFEAEFVEDEHGKIVMRKKVREQPG